MLAREFVLGHHMIFGEGHRMAFKESHRHRLISLQLKQEGFTDVVERWSVENYDRSSVIES